MHLSNENLMAYLDGEANDYLSHHLDDCSSCASDLKPYLALQQELLQTLYRSHCPPGQMLSNLHLGLLAEADSAAVAAHLAGCLLCQAEVDRLKQFLEEDAILREKSTP